MQNNAWLMIACPQGLATVRPDAMRREDTPSSLRGWDVVVSCACPDQPSWAAFDDAADQEDPPRLIWVHPDVDPARADRALVLTPAPTPEAILQAATPPTFSAAERSRRTANLPTGLLESYLAGRQAALRAAAQAWRRGDDEAVSRFAHQTRGSAGTYGFDYLSVLASELEDALHGGSTRATRDALLRLRAWLGAPRPA